MLRDFDIRSIQGLTEAQAAERLKNEGFNELPSSRKKSIFFIALEVIREPMFLLLVACGVLYTILGDIHEALMLLGFVFIVMGITIYQEQKTERALEALRDMSSPRALVIRDGEPRRIAGREVVREDVIVIYEGDRVPADAVILWSVGLKVDESLLTGESVPVRKLPLDGELQPCRPGGDDLPCVYSGTLAVQGQAVARVLATGAGTEMGKIGKALQSLEQEETRLQKETGRLVRTLALIGLVLCLLVIVVYGLTRGDWPKGVLAGITLAMAMLPEEFPVVLTIFMAMGAWRISRQKVLTRRVPVLETLGSATVLCVDKTGTLTQNRMTVSKIYANGSFLDVEEDERPTLPEEFHPVVEFAILASQKDPFDPMDKALKQLGITTLHDTEHLHDDWTMIQEYPISRELLVLSHVWKGRGEDGFVIGAKGAPEAVADVCHFDEARMKELQERVEVMVQSGLRVLGVAKAVFRAQSLPPQQHDFVFEFLGLIGFADPVRPEVADAIKECYEAGVRVVMITGDYPGTALNIARQIGLSPGRSVITGPELDAMEDGDLQERAGETNIFARMVPEQKLRLVEALKARGEVVAMTGDGVNDAPALKSAHIGIAMGGRGTDVARESASLVLLNDDFSSIVQAVRMGRRIFDNLKKAMSYIFAVHVPIAGLSLLPVLFKWPLVLLPVHIMFMELIIDPACSVVFEAEPEEEGVMSRPPRNPSDPLFSLHTVGISLLQGMAVLLIMLVIYVASLRMGQPEDEARALTFTSLIVANLGLILINRSWTRTILSTLKTPNGALWWVMGGAAGFMGLVLYVPFLQKLFHFSSLGWFDILICLAAGLLSIAWFEAMKVLSRRHLLPDSLCLKQ